MTKTFDVREFEKFCRSKPADERYDGGDPCRCALGQFGFKWVDSDDLQGIPSPVYWATVFCGAEKRKPKLFHTFGALANRLAKLSPQ